MASSNRIHPSAVIDGDVQLGSGNVVEAFSVLLGPLVIGDGNVIGPHAVIGTPGDEIWQRRHDSTGKQIQIGSRCLIREHVTIHKPVYGEQTLIGDDVYLMHGAYVAHDTILENHAILAQNAVIGGLARVQEGGYVAMGGSLHQQTICGAYAIVGAAAAAVRSVRPFTRHVPGQPPTLNAYAIDRYGLDAQRDEIVRYVSGGGTPTSRRIAAMVAEYEALVAQTGRGEY